MRGAGAAERSGTEECGVCGVWRKRGGVLWASGVGDGSGDGAAAGDSGVRSGVRGSPVGGGGAVLSGGWARRGPAAARFACK